MRDEEREREKRKRERQKRVGEGRVGFETGSCPIGYVGSSDYIGALRVVAQLVPNEIQGAGNVEGGGTIMITSYLDQAHNKSVKSSLYSMP